MYSLYIYIYIHYTIYTLYHSYIIPMATAFPWEYLTITNLTTQHEIVRQDGCYAHDVNRVSAQVSIWPYGPPVLANPLGLFGPVH